MRERSRCGRMALILAACLLAALAGCGGDSGALETARGGGTGSVGSGRAPGGQAQAAVPQTLPDPGNLLGVEGVLLDSSVQLDGLEGTYALYRYEWSLLNGANSGWGMYQSLLEARGFSCEREELEENVDFYYIAGDSGAALALYDRSESFLVSVELYVPEGMAFTLGSSGGGSGGRLPSGGDSFQNGSFQDQFEDPVVVDGVTYCTACNGSGNCGYCHGAGRVRNHEREYEDCTICGGSGDCPVCDGAGTW